MTITDAGLDALVLQLGRARAARLNLQETIDAVCRAVVSSLGLGGAVVFVPIPGSEAEGGLLGASDDRARWLGDTQRREGQGPLLNAVRTGRALVTEDLTRIGPPALAAAADDCGLVSSVVHPLTVEGRTVAAFQMLGTAQRPVSAAEVPAVLQLLDVMAARLADVADLRAAGRVPDEARRLQTAGPQVDDRTRPAPAARAGAVPAPDSPHAGRHRPNGGGAGGAPMPAPRPAEDDETRALPVVDTRPAHAAGDTGAGQGGRQWLRDVSRNPASGVHRHAPLHRG